MKLLAEQIEDAAKMASASDLPNFSKAGTGKTHTALEAVRLVNHPRLLVLCPKIALSMWGEEIDKYLGMSVQVIRSAKSPIKGTDAIVTTYDLAASMKGKLIESHTRTLGVLINDESHHVNGATAKRTKALFGDKLDLVGSIAERFDQVWNLTGTPMTAYADGMFTQAAILHPEVFAPYKADTYDKFASMFTFKRQKQYNKAMQPIWKISGNTKEGFLNRLIYQELGAIRRLEAKGLPDIVHRELEVEVKLTAEVKKLLKGMTPEKIVAMLNDPESVIAKVWHTIGLMKVAETVPYIGECADQGPVLVGVWHRDVSKEYADKLSREGFTVAEVNGSTADKAKDEIRTAFNAGTIDVVVGQMAAMGVSWNIQEACAHVIIAEEHPSATVVEQFYKRVYRYGQKRAVQVDYITSNNEIDQGLRRVRERKAAGNEKING